jgi:hypothetical protein
LRVLRRVIAKFYDDIPRGWSELGEEIVSTSLLEYSRAHAGGREVVHSASYQRESKRIEISLVMCWCVMMNVEHMLNMCARCNAS